MYSYDNFTKLKIKYECTEKVFKTDEVSIDKAMKFIQSLKKKNTCYTFKFVRKRKRIYA